MNHPLQNILLVEDDPDIQVVAKLALEVVGGFTVQAFDSGMAVLARDPGSTADLILLDVMMPGMDGLTTLTALRAQPATSTTPVVFMTAQVQPNDVARYRELGAAGVISKPFDPMTLPDKLREIWRGEENVTEQYDQSSGG